MKKRKKPKPGFDPLMWFISDEPPKRKKIKQRLVGHTPDGTNLKVILERGQRAF